MKSIALAWYSKEQYNEALCIMEDAPDDAPSYEDWLVRAEKTVKAMEDGGVKVVRVEINGVEFSEWCFKYSLKRDADARSKFAMWKLGSQIYGRDLGGNF
jgi:hypothetical protein